MKDYFGKDASKLKEKKLFLFDMDGTVYLGERLFDGVKVLLENIEKAYASPSYTVQPPSSIRYH